MTNYSSTYYKGWFYLSSVFSKCILKFYNLTITSSYIDSIITFYKTIFIAGGYSIYKYFLDNFEIDEIFLSKIKDSVEVKKAVEPLYFPNIEDYGYKIVDKKDYEEFIAYVYKK